jgi:predicted PurR-regulated permease PerM
MVPNSAVTGRTAPGPHRQPLVVRIGAHAWAVLGILVLVATVLWLVSKVMVVVVPLLVALFPAAALAPAQRWLVSKGWPRPLAAFVLLAGLVGVLAGVIAGPIPLLTTQLPVLVQSVSAAAGRLSRLLDRISGGHAGSRLGGVDSLTQQLTGWLFGGDPVAGTLSLASTVVNVLSGLVLTLLTVFFLLYRGATASDATVGLIPEQHRAAAVELGSRLWQTLGTYVRAQLLVGMVDAVLIGIGLVLLGVPIAVPLALVIFIGAQVPIIGAIVTGALAVLVGLAHGGLGLALAVLAVVVGVEFLESHFLQPLIMSRTARLPALAVIVAVAVGTALLGVLGALVAVPVLSMLIEGVRFARERGGAQTAQQMRVPNPRLRRSGARLDQSTGPEPRSDGRRLSRSGWLSRSARQS